jgi:diguanylate cyclase (GGDEF)-like protein
MTAPSAPTGARFPRQRQGIRLTSRAFWDLALWMAGLGLLVGLLAPPLAVALGAPADAAGQPWFRAACLAVCGVVGVANYLVCRRLMGGRMTVLSGHLRGAADVITTASHSGDWSGVVLRPIAVDSADQIGDAARAFNSLLEAVEGRKELEERLRAQAYHDVLTGLPNRALFLDRLAEARRPGTASAVLFVDLDNLKSVNDNLGHENGDVLIRSVSRRLRDSVRAEDTVARLSGDEFAILLVGPSSEAEAERVADRILDSMRAPVNIGDHLVRSGVSIGLATSTTCARSDVDLLRAADMAMYAAKTSGKGRLVVFRPSHHTAQLARDALRADLHEALDGDQLELHYQPIVAVGTGQVSGFEALLRWRHPARGLVPPAEFIPLAEETGLIVPIGRWVLHEATRQAAAWQQFAPSRQLGMSVNVSVRQFQHTELLGDLTRALCDSGLDPQLLTLEITESLFADDSVETGRKLDLISRLGVRLALDDFGSGYSSLSYMRRFPIDTLKIDKSFIDELTTSTEGHALVAAITQLGRTLGLTVVAEGLESAAQVEALSRLACPLGQGYHFARPMPAAQAEALLAAAGDEPAALLDV